MRVCVTTYSFSSAGESGDLAIFAPGVTAADDESAKNMASGLATGEQQVDPRGTGGAPSCAEQCKNTYEAEKKNALDRYVTNMKVYCGVLGVPGGFVTGCGIGVAICGWAVPPFSTAFCCIAGGIIGSGATFSGCACAQNEIYQSELRRARNTYVACLENCGVTTAEQ